MSIIREDFKYYKSAVFNDTSVNGGLASSNLVVDGVAENIFPSIPQSERIAGSNKYRKVYAKVDNAAAATLYLSRFFIENPTSAGDAVFAFPAGSFTQKQSDLLGTERVYGCGWLNASVVVGATELIVRTESSTKLIFLVGDTVRVSNKTNIDDVVGTEEFRTVSAVTWNSNVATVTLDVPLDNNYSFSNDATRVASVMQLGEIKTSSTTPVVTSTGGSLDASKLTLTNKGAIYQNWTLTFSSSSNFSIVGDTVGSVGSGNVTSGASPNNPAVSAPYFTLASAGLSGLFASGDTITFRTNPAQVGIWFQRVVPANTPAFTGNRFTFVLDGETD